MTKLLTLLWPWILEKIKANAPDLLEKLFHTQVWANTGEIGKLIETAAMAAVVGQNRATVDTIRASTWGGVGKLPPETQLKARTSAVLDTLTAVAQMTGTPLGAVMEAFKPLAEEAVDRSVEVAKGAIPPQAVLNLYPDGPKPGGGGIIKAIGLVIAVASLGGVSLLTGCVSMPQATVTENVLTVSKIVDELTPELFGTVPNVDPVAAPLASIARSGAAVFWVDAETLPKADRVRKGKTEMLRIARATFPEIKGYAELAATVRRFNTITASDGEQVEALLLVGVRQDMPPIAVHLPN